MIHAREDLIRAMRNDPDCRSAMLLNVDEWGERACLACGASVFQGCWSFLGRCAALTTVEDVQAVTCPACLALMAAARGAERTAELMVYADALEGVVAAYDHAAASALPSEEALKALGRHTRAVLALQAIRAAVPVVPGVAA